MSTLILFNVLCLVSNYLASLQMNVGRTDYDLSA